MTETLDRKLAPFFTATEESQDQRAKLIKTGTLIRFCNYCGCQIEDQRRARKSPYCTNEHRRLAVNEKRELRATEGPCRICGRSRRVRLAKAAEKGCATAAQVGA